MFISLHAAKRLAKKVLSVGHVPMVTSSPGIGKSAIAKELAKEANLKLIDLRLSQCDPTDLGGFPTINEDRTKAGYVPMDTFPIVGDELPIKVAGVREKDWNEEEHGLDDWAVAPVFYSGWFLLLDEFNSASEAVQAAAYKLVLDKEVGQFTLHPAVHIMAAGNLMTDKAIVNRTSTATQSRLIHTQVECNMDEWMEWAQKTAIDYRVIGFINFKPESLHSFDPNHNDLTFPCPRTWHFLSDLIASEKNLMGEGMDALLAGTVGEGMASEFRAFCDVYGEIPDIKEIIANPKTVKFEKTNPSISYALSSLVGSHFDVDKPDDALRLVEFTERLDIEFQVITLQGAVRRDKSFLQVPAIKSWVYANAEYL